MNSYEAKTSGNLVAVQLSRGDDLLLSIQKAIAEHGITNGAVISGIGTLDQCVLHFVSDSQNAKSIYYKKWEDVLFEVTGIHGIIANGQPHLHMVVSDTNNAWAGHVEPGCRTLFLCEMLILVFDEHSVFDRVHATQDKDDTNYAIMNLVKL